MKITILSSLDFDICLCDKLFAEIDIVSENRLIQTFKDVFWEYEGFLWLRKEHRNVNRYNVKSCFYWHGWWTWTTYKLSFVDTKDCALLWYGILALDVNHAPRARLSEILDLSKRSTHKDRVHVFSKDKKKIKESKNTIKELYSADISHSNRKWPNKNSNNNNKRTDR